MMSSMRGRATWLGATRLIVVCAGWLATAAVSGCQQDEVSAQASQAPTVRFELSAAAAGKVEQALASYENIRAKLAKDELAVAEDAATLEASATAASALTSADGQAVLNALAAAAKALKGMPTSDADALRKSFGEVSRQVVALIAAVPALAQGRFAFSCPMAQGFQKWVQTKPQIDNPYMGKKMLTCGSATTF